MGTEMNLVDDLADVLAHMVVGWKPTLGVDLAEHPDVVRVMARFRAEREQALRTYAWGLEVEVDCIAFGNSLHSRVNGVIQRIEPVDYMVNIRKPKQEPLYTYDVTYPCRKCHGEIKPGQYRFGSVQTGWEHMEGECV